MARTGTQLEQALSIRIGDYITGTTSAAGNAGGTTAITTSDDVMSRAGQSFVPYYLELTSGTYNGQVRQISDFSVTAGVGTLTVVNAFGGQVAISVTFRIHRIPPNEKLRNLSAVLGEMNDILPRIVVEEMLTGELLRNANLEQWRADTPYDWDVITGTATRETSVVYQGLASLKLVTASGLVRQRIALERDLEDETLTLTGYVYGKIANGPQIGITANGTTTYSSAVAANDTWQQVTVSKALTSGIQPIYIVLFKGSGADTAYFDRLHLIIASQQRVSVIPISDAFGDVRQVLWRQGIDTTTDPSQLDYVLKSYAPSLTPPNRIYGGYGYYNSELDIDHFIQVLGIGIWPTLSALTDSVDISADEAPLVVHRAALRLMKVLAARDHLSDAEHWKGIEADLLREEPVLIPNLRRHAPTKHLAIPIR